MFRKIIEKLKLMFVGEEVLLSSDKAADKDVSKAQKIVMGLAVLAIFSLAVWLFYAFLVAGEQQAKFTSFRFMSERRSRYVNFFETEHPFMLYVFLPVIGIFSGSTKIVSAMKIYSLLLMLFCGGAFLGAIHLFIKEKYVSLKSFIYKFEFAVLAVISLTILVWFTYTFVLLGDEREHLGSTFLIYNGQRPYVDFFEHHHPLLWYVFLPVFHFFQNSGEVWYATRTFELALILINAFVVFKIAYLIVPNRFFAWLSALFSICSHVVFVAQITFRPDTLMSLLLFCGLYFFLRYLKEHKNNSLYLAFVFFFFSFMAQQKALIFLFFVGMLILYLIYKKEISFCLILKALIEPVVLFAAYLFYLYHTGALKDYFELNYLLNIKARYLFTYEVASSIWFWLGNVLAVIILATKQPRLLKYMSFLCICFSVILYILGTFVQYWVPLYSLLAVISAYVVLWLADSLRIVVLAIIIVSTAFNNLIYIKDQKVFPPLDFFVGVTNKVVKTALKNEKIIGNIEVVGGLREDATGYYWFGRDYMAVIDNHYFNRHPLPNINDIIRKEKPKIVVIRQQLGCTNDDYTNTRKCDKQYMYDFEFLSKRYIPDGPLLIRQDKTQIW